SPRLRIRIRLRWNTPNWRLRSASLAELADYRADDVGVIVAPHPLIRVGALQRPIRGLREVPEIFLVARNRSDRGGELVGIGRLVDIRAFTDECRQPVRCGDARHHRSELKMAV